MTSIIPVGSATDVKVPLFPELQNEFANEDESGSHESQQNSNDNVENDNDNLDQSDDDDTDNASCSSVSSVSHTFYTSLPNELQTDLQESEKHRIISNIESYLNKLTFDQIEDVWESCQIVNEHFDGIVDSMVTSLGNDEELQVDDHFQNLVGWSTLKRILRAYNTTCNMIRNLKQESNMNDEIMDSDGNRNEQHIACENGSDESQFADFAESGDNLTKFEELIAYLLNIGVAHRHHKVGHKYLLVIRSHLLKVLKSEFGGDWHPQLEQAWLQFLNFLNIGICAASKLSQKSVIIPEKNMFFQVKGSWGTIKPKMPQFLESFWKELAKDTSNLVRYFADEKKLKCLIKFNTIVRLFDDPDTMIDKLGELGYLHASIVSRNHDFKRFIDCWLATLKTMCGVKYTDDMAKAWNQVLFFFSKTMLDTLQEQQMLEIPEDPEIIKVYLKLLHLGELIPHSSTFNCDVDIAATNGANKPKLMRQIAQDAAIESQQKEAESSSKNDPSPRAMRRGSLILHRFHSYNRGQSDVQHIINNAKEAPKTNISLNGYNNNNNNNNSTGKNNTSGIKWKIKIENSLYTEEQYSKRNEFQKIQLPDASIYQRTRLRGSFVQPLNMKAFPFDKHLLKFHVGLDCNAAVAKFDKCDIEIELGDSALPEAIDIGGADWEVRKPFFERYCVLRDSARGEDIGYIPFKEAIHYDRSSYSQHIMIVIPITRKWGNFLPQIFFPMQIIDFIALCTYNVNPLPSIYDRYEFLGVLVGCMLAFRYTVDRTLPKVPYLTHLDYHFNFAYLMILFHCLWAGVLTQYLSTVGVYNKQFDTYSFLVALLLYAAGKFYLCKTGYFYVQSMSEYDEKNLSKLQKTVTMQKKSAKKKIVR